MDMITYPFGIEDKDIFTNTIQEVKDKYPNWTFDLFECPEGVRNWDYTLSVYASGGYNKTYQSITPKSVEAWWKRGQKRNVVSWRYKFFGRNDSIEDIENFTNKIVMDLKGVGCILTKTDKKQKKYGCTYSFKKGQSVITLFSYNYGVTLHIDKVRLP